MNPQSACEPGDSPAQTAAGRSSPGGRPSRRDRSARSAAVLLCVLHGAAIWVGMGGREGMPGDWPPAPVRPRHPLPSRTRRPPLPPDDRDDRRVRPEFHERVRREHRLGPVLDPVRPRHAGLGRPPGAGLQGPRLRVRGAGALARRAGRDRLEGEADRGPGRGRVVPRATSGRISRSSMPRLGMLNYLLSVPLGLVAVAGLASYLRTGRSRAMGLGLGGELGGLPGPPDQPDAGRARPGSLAYAVAVVRARREGRAFPASRHVGFWAIAPGDPGGERVLVAAGLLPGVDGGRRSGRLRALRRGGLGAVRRDRSGSRRRSRWPCSGWPRSGWPCWAVATPVAAAGLGAFLAAGFGWGYLAGAFPALDALQPGRHTYACYSAACVAAGIGLGEVFARLRPGVGGSTAGRRWSACSWAVSASSARRSRSRSGRRLVAPVPFLSSRPTPRMVWVVEKVRTHVKPGERLLFEETGLGARAGSTRSRTSTSARSCPR